MNAQSALRSFLISLQFTVYPVFAVLFSIAAGDGAIGSLPVFAAWFGAHWFAVVAGLIANPAPYWRARQAVLAGNAGIPPVNPLAPSAAQSTPPTGA